MQIQFDQVTVPFKATFSFSPLVLDYLEGKKSLTPYFKWNASDPSLTERIASRERFPPSSRNTLVNVLRSQYEELARAGVSIHPEVLQHIDLLERPDAFTVTTGHQLNLFAGPLYTVYKIASVIRLAQLLKEKNPGAKIVPVFWLASEDHDLDEIDHVSCIGKKIRWEHRQSGPAGAVLTNGVQELIQTELLPLIAHEPFANRVEELLLSAYSEGGSLSLATRKLINGLFGEFGIVCLDPNVRELKQLMIPYFTDELQHHTAEKWVSGSSKELQDLGYPTQVHPRPINLFYLQPGSRERIVNEAENFRVLNTEKVFTPDEILRELNAFPERFSPNVILRPVFQEVILPDLAYIGGPAEVSYWLQFRALFDHWKIPFPAIHLRHAALQTDPRSIQRLDKLGIDLLSVFRPVDVLIREYLESHRDADSELSGEVAQVNDALDRIIEKAERSDPTLRAAAEGERARILAGIDKLNEKMIRSLRRREETAISQIRKLKDQLFPDGSPQERSEGFITFYSKYGPDWIRAVVNSVDPFDPSFKICSTKD